MTKLLNDGKIAQKGTVTLDYKTNKITVQATFPQGKFSIVWDDEKQTGTVNFGGNTTNIGATVGKSLQKKAQSIAKKTQKKKFNWKSIPPIGISSLPLTVRSAFTKMGASNKLIDMIALIAIEGMLKKQPANVPVVANLCAAISTDQSEWHNLRGWVKPFLLEVTSLCREELVKRKK